MASPMRVRVLRVAPAERFLVPDGASVVGVQGDADPTGRSLLVFIAEPVTIEEPQTGEAAVTAEVEPT